VTLAGYALYSLTREPTSQSLAYALRKGLAREAAEKFKDVNYDENSKGLIDLVAQLPWNKQISSDVLNILDEITKDNEVTALEKNLFDDKFVNQTKPQVEVSWEPEKVVWDKIYDIKVHIVAQDDKTPIANVTLRFIPVEYEYFITKYGMRPEDYPKAFPPDKERVMNLTPLDGKFDELREEFEADIKDIVGGREYRIVAVVKDLAGNENTVEIKTPYIRQFENVAKQDNITVAAFYYNWYTKGYEIPHDLPDPPLLGFYDSHDNMVFNKHVDWATGHGIDVFVFPYFGRGEWAKWQEDIMDENMKADLFSQIKFSFISTFVDRPERRPPYNFDDPLVKQDFIDNINYLLEKYGKEPNFWRIDGKPVIVTWSTHAYQSAHGNVVDAFEKIGSGEKVLIIADIPSNLARDEKYYPFLQAPVYGLYNYQPLLGPIPPPWDWKTPPRVKFSEIYNNIISVIKDWNNFSKRMNIKYIFVVSPGFDNTYDYRGPNSKAPIIERDTNSFKKLVQYSLKNSNIIFVTTFNEWFEGTSVEPSRGYGLEYLKILKEVLEGR